MHCYIHEAIGIILLQNLYLNKLHVILLDFSLTVKVATLIFTSGRASAISTAKEGKSGSVYNLIKNK